MEDDERSIASVRHVDFSYKTCQISMFRYCCCCLAFLAADKTMVDVCWVYRFLAEGKVNLLVMGGGVSPPLVGNLVAPLFDGLDHLLDNGGLVHDLGGGQGVGGGGGGMGDGNGGSGSVGVGGGGGSIAVGGSRGVAQVGVGSGVGETVGVGQDGIGGATDGGNSAGENNL
jgi:hypothetical protein